MSRGVRPDPRYRCLESAEVYAGRVVRVATRRILLPGGVPATHEVLTLPAAVAVVALLEEGGRESVVLVEQFRSSVEGYIHEIPAGVLEAGEEPAACAARELEEETGYRAGRIEPLASLLPIPGTSAHRMHYFLAEGLAPGRQRLEPAEVLAVKLVPLAEALRALRGEGPLDIVDSKTHIGLLHLALRRGMLERPVR